MFLCNFHLNDGTKCMPRYVFASFWDIVGKGLLFNRMIWACVNALNLMNLSLDLSGIHVMAQLARSMCAHSKNLCSLCIYGYMYQMLCVIMAMPFAYAMVLQVVVEVLKCYPMLFVSKQRSSWSRKIMKRYGLSISPLDCTFVDLNWWC